MFRKPKWWDVPITWGDSAKMSLIGAGVGLAINAVVFVVIPYVNKKREQKRLEEEERENLDYLG